jgi:hypothetical protein
LDFFLSLSQTSFFENIHHCFQDGELLLMSRYLLFARISKLFQKELSIIETAANTTAADIICKLL